MCLFTQKAAKMKSLTTLLCVLLVKTCIANPCSSVESLDISNGVVMENGSVFMFDMEFTKDTWYEVKNETGYQRFGCPCIGRSCLWKCCEKKQLFNNSMKCVDSEASEVNPLNLPLYRETVPTGGWSSALFYYMHGWPCGERYLVDTALDNEDFYVQEDGQLLEISAGGSQLQPAAHYCVDMRSANESEPPRLVSVICFPDPNANTDDDRILYMSYAFGLMISVPFFLATFLVYALIPELRNIHGMCLMAYCAGLIVAYSFLAYLKLHTGTVGVAMTGCLVIAFIVYYAFQTSFFWLNVMCFDIWRTFSGYRGGSSNKRRERNRFALYALYAWGTPVLLTGFTATMQFTDIFPNLIRPGFGSRRCWFVDRYSDLLYFYSPVLTLVVCNVIFFSVTAYRIRSIKQETAILKGAESSRSDRLKKDKQRYNLYLKLFLVMGVNWTVEMVSFAVGGSNWFWLVMDISIIALGGIMFFIFVWKKKVRQLVRRRFRTMFGIESAQDSRANRWDDNSAPTDDTRISSEDTGLRLKEFQ